MADINTQLYPDKGSTNPFVVRVSGRFIGNGASAPTRIAGRKFSVSRVSSGLYRITFDFSFNAILSFVPTLALVTKDTWFPQGVAESVSARTFDLRIIDEANALVDIDYAGTPHAIDFNAALQVSALPAK